MTLFANKVAFVTGASQGIGKATALILAKYGAYIVAVDISKEVERTAEEIKQLGRECISVITDVTNRERVESAVKTAIKQFDKLDILVNCAGIVSSSLLLDLPEELWDKTIDVNLKGVYLVSQAVSKEMVKRRTGKIVNISSQASKVGEIGNGAYCASKAGVNALTQVLALELAPYNINVNAVCPGYTDTEIMQKVFEIRGPIEQMTPADYEKDLLSQCAFEAYGQT
ncbi:3-oxoacyl-[acyl-carrier protein] reductase [Desulfosporosinus metallidurans]|uniref:3-oxoacyl-[acyl-carrier protein] reductase n=1 Tax=Desulfosporosinus metallidurans TaxID=1888891 RepID=A0A1Q8QZJ7_9FIRM|nr:3-oxoacyl-[acyl-carrier protein] reductase [Desulfosporosinus metallidurans]